MRRFYGFLVLITSLLLIVIASIQPQVRNISSGLEYEGGHEALFEVDLKDSDKSIADVADIVVKRINDAGVENASVTYEHGQNESDEKNYIRVQMNAENEDELDYVLRSVEATGTISVSTLMASGDYDYVIDNPFNIGSATVEWSKSNPFVLVDLKKGVEKEFKDFMETCNNAYSDFQATYHSGEEEEEEGSIKGVMIIWLDKTDADNYVSIFTEQDPVKQEQMKKKILAIVPTDNFQFAEKVDGTFDYAKLLISYYDYDQKSMETGSAHTIERIINYGASDYEMTRLYTSRINATEGNNYARFILMGVGVSALALLVFLVIKHRLAGLAGFSAIAVSLLMQLVVFNFFSFTFTTMVALAFVVSLIANAAYVIVYLNRFKEELYKGKSALKARQEANKVTLSNFIDVAVCGLFVTIIALFAVTSQVKLLPSIMIVGFGSSLIFNRLITLFSMYWLTNNTLAQENKKIFGCKDQDVPNILEGQSQIKFNKSNKLDPKKNGKLSTIILGAISLVGALIIVVMAIIPGVSIFNESNEGKTYSRFEISSELSDTHYLFETKDAVKNYFSNKYPDLVITNVDIVIKEDVLISGREDMPDMAYVSVSLGNKIDEAEFQNYVVAIKDDLQNMSYGDTAQVSLTNVTSSSVTYLVKSAIVVVSLFGGLAVLFVTLRYGYTYGLSTLVTLIPSTLATLGIFAATRLEISALSLTGIAAGLLVVVIAQLPLFENIKKLKHDAKGRITTYEGREEIAINATKYSMETIFEIILVAIASTLIVALCSPLTYSVLSTYASMLIALILGLVSTYLILVPVYLFFTKKIHYTNIYTNKKRLERQAEKNKKRMEQAKAENRNKGAEAKESIIPGIND